MKAENQRVKATRQTRLDKNYCLVPIPYSLLLSTGGEVANAQVCKTCIRGFNPRPVLQILS